MTSWYRETNLGERRTFWACFGGWALDALDVQLFSLVIPTLIVLWHITTAEAGFVTSFTLVASALGGWVGGAVSDRIGRVRALLIMVGWFAGATFLSAFAQNYGQLLFLKALQGLGFGGEWAAGVALMSEAIRPQFRGRALASVQSAWAIGWGCAVLLYTAAYSMFDPSIAWRVLFALGLVPALLVVWVRRNVAEPQRTHAAHQPTKVTILGTFMGVFAPQNLRVTLIGLLLGTGAHGGYYAVTSWLPTYLKTERHLSTLATGGYLAVIIVAFFCGCLAAAFLLDRVGRRLTLGLFAVSCVVIVPIYVILPLTDAWALVLGFPLGFVSAGIPASMGAVFSELYPSEVRGTGVGFCYNAGRILAAAFPFLVGRFAQTIGLGPAIGVDAAIGYGLVVLAVLLLPETNVGRARKTVGQVAIPGVLNAPQLVDSQRAE